jgi:beta-lactamase class A
MNTVFFKGLAIGCAAGLGFAGVGVMAHSVMNSSAKINLPFSSVELRSGGYTYINPLLECADQQNISFINTKFTKEEFLKFEDSIKASGRASKISVYYRDLNNGPWFGFNDDAVFLPASLFKVPVMIALFLQAEKSPGLFDKEILYEQIFEESMQNIVYGEPMSVGSYYTVRNLITKMIADSNNEALYLLANTVLDESLSENVTKDLGLELELLPSGAEGISVRKYARLFRVLYNASYLNKASSEEALRILTQSSFSRGLEAGVPSHVEVAHKFGERIFLGLSQEERQLHDCGVVYAPNGSYVLCVMTRGNDLYQLSGVVRDVSAYVYSHLHESN